MHSSPKAAPTPLAATGSNLTTKPPRHEGIQFLRLILLLISFTITISIADARILNVPEEYETIQDGIDVAEDGDTVLVQPGTYEENIRIETAGITLGSLLLTTNDDEFIGSTIIDGGGNESVVAIWVRGRPAVVLRGLTIQNGDPRGIDCQIGRIFLEDMLITGNSGSSCGGGILAEAHESGGAWVTVRRCLIDQNAAHFGGGISTLSATMEIEDCVISNNQATSNQQNYFGGGGIHTWTSMYVRAPEVTIRRTILLNNYSEYDYGAAYFLWGRINVDHLTIVGNTVGGNRGHGGLGFGSDGRNLEATITNSILYGNEGFEIHTLSGNISTSYSDISGGRNGVDEARQNQLGWGAGMISDDPLFADPDNGDYHLRENSPCIDAGDPNSPPDPDSTRTDIGAFYFPHHVPPQVVRDIPDVMVEEDCGRFVIADLDTVFRNPAEDTLFFAFAGLENLGLFLEEGNVFGIEPLVNFYGDSFEVQLSARDAEDTTAIGFLVSINPVNDAQIEFDLLSPPSNSMLVNGDTVRFRWRVSTDPDSENVDYRLRIADLEGGRPRWFWRYSSDTTWFDLRVGFNIGSYVWEVESITVHDTVTSRSQRYFGVMDPDAVPTSDTLHPSLFTLHSAFPNPFNSSTTIRFSTGSQAAPTRLAVYGIDGRLVEEFNGKWKMENGTEHSVVWNAEGLPGGIYLIRLESGREVKIIKSVLMK